MIAFVLLTLFSNIWCYNESFSQAIHSGKEPIKGGKGGQCTKYVHEQATWTKKYIRDANLWWDDSQTNDRNRTPILNGVIVFGVSSRTPKGHVGIVTNVNGNEITIKHSNWAHEPTNGSYTPNQDIYTNVILKTDDNWRSITIPIYSNWYSKNNKPEKWEYDSFKYPILGFLKPIDIGGNVTNTLNSKFIEHSNYKSERNKLKPNIVFFKSWRIENNGSVDWDVNRIELRPIDNNARQMAGNRLGRLERNNAVGNTVKVTIELTSPGSIGKYIGTFQLFDRTTNKAFGEQIPIEIEVVR